MAHCRQKFSYFHITWSCQLLNYMNLLKIITLIYQFFKSHHPAGVGLEKKNKKFKKPSLKMNSLLHIIGAEKRQNKVRDYKLEHNESDARCQVDMNFMRCILDFFSPSWNCRQQQRNWASLLQHTLHTGGGVRARTD